MTLSGVDWGEVAPRAGAIAGLWVVIWLLQRYLVRWTKTADRHMAFIELSEKETRVIGRVVDIVLLIIGIGITLGILKVSSFFWIGTVGWRLLALVLLWTAVWVLVRYLSDWILTLDDKVEGIDIDPRDLKTMDRLVDWAIILVGIIATLAILNVTSLLYSALTAAGIASLVIGFAVKDMAANFISGVFLLIDRPFVVGDSIAVKGYSGTVSSISLRSTEIITFDGPVVTIPNSTMAVEPTTNYTLSQHRRPLFTISVLNTADLNLAIKTIQGILNAEDRLLPDKPPSILVNQIREYAVDFQVIAYTSKEDFVATQSDLQKEIVAAFASQGIELAVPVRMNLSPANLVRGVE